MDSLIIVLPGRIEKITVEVVHEGSGTPIASTKDDDKLNAEVENEHADSK